MTRADHQQVINELQAVIDDTQRTLTRFEEAGMNEAMPNDYARLHAILDDAVTSQREHTQAMLGQESCVDRQALRPASPGKSRPLR